MMARTGFARGRYMLFFSWPHFQSTFPAFPTESNFVAPLDRNPGHTTGSGLNNSSRLQPSLAPGECFGISRKGDVLIAQVKVRVSVSVWVLVR